MNSCWLMNGHKSLTDEPFPESHAFNKSGRSASRNFFIHVHIYKTRFSPQYILIKPPINLYFLQALYSWLLIWKA